MAAALARAALLPRSDHRLGLGAALALLAHAGLIGALALGLNWRLPRQQAVLSAELWAAVPQVAAPGPAARPAPSPSPSPAPAPAPAVKPEPVRRAEPPPPSAAEREAEIALEKAAQKKNVQQETLAREAREAAERERQAAADARRLKQQQADRQKQDDKRLADEKAQARQRDLAAKDAKARDEQRQRDLAQLRDQQQKEAAAKVQDAQLARQREENLKRMLGQAGGAGAARPTGAAGLTSATPAGPTTSAGYAGRVSARIKSNLIKAAEVTGNPVTEVEVKCAPDGSIVGRRITQASGNPVWDDIVLRAIDRTATLPRDTDGRIPPTMLLTFSRQE